ncbi:MMS19 nucleotide excision repair protein homolog isoform X2 [Oreochromis niloticus]|uniref:MMS19 nucleotide excision repair protein homolog isoform X2 n=1 Tax=Oreochromis niloticus TaxID=8128 RepID=UPI000DF17179|nr:MMS19 nucleotide excision repair protein homolog isoform X2 [Oreochromis niloticus]
MAAESTLALSLVEEFVSGLQDSKAKDAAKGVKDGKFTVLQLVEALGSSLTSSQPHTRARGVHLLSEVLQECYGDLTEREGTPFSFHILCWHCTASCKVTNQKCFQITAFLYPYMSSDDAYSCQGAISTQHFFLFFSTVEVLIAFYENRLKDHYVVTPPVLKGLKALTKCTNLPPGSAVSMLRSVFQDIHVQSLMLSERACVYSMLINIMETREAELKGLGADFVFGFVQSMDGERDPRNLLLAFQIAKNLIHGGYDLGKFTEELFEVTSCYFPIDFSPPPNDPHGITREELVQALRAVLTGTPKFAEFLLPLLIEKLDSDVQSAKLDSLQTLAACVSQYEHKHVAEFLQGLWTSVRREVFQTSSEKIESAGLAALTALTSCLSRSVLSSDSEDSLSTFLDFILKDCKHHLCEPDLKLVWPSAKLLQAACSASTRASHIITVAVMPSLLEQYNNRTQCSHRRTLLEVVQRFIHSVKNCQSSDNDESVLLAFREALCSIVFSALSESNSSLQITATSVLTSLAQQAGLLVESDIELALDHLTRLLLTEEDDRVSLAVVECAGALAQLHPALVITKLIPKLKKEMFTEPMNQDQEEVSELHSHHAVRQRCLSALAAVSIQPSVVQESTPVLLEVLRSAHTGSVNFSVDEVVLTCRSLQRIAERVQDSEEAGRCFHDVFIPHLLSLALQAALQGEGSSGTRSPLVEEVVLSAMVPVISTSCSRLQPTLAGQTASRAVSLFLDGDVSFLPDNSFPSHMQLLKEGDSWSLSRLVCLLMGSVCSLPRSVEVPQIDKLLSALEEMSCACSHPLSYTSAAKCFAGLVNKKPQGDSLDSLIQRMMKRVCSELDSPSSSVRTQAFTLMIWVAKALLLRYHPLFTTLTDKLFSLLDDADLGPMAADGFSLLMSDSTDVLNRACHADVRIMYRQRFFSENSAKLVQGFNAAPQEKKPNYLKALSNIVNKLPKQVQVTELPALLSLLLEALSCPDQDIHLSTLSCLEPVLVNPPQVLIQQLEALINRLLALISSPAMSVRIASLSCISTLSHFPVHEVLPFRARVLRALAKPLDDKKRLVRREAVQARGEWFLLGSPGGR